MNKYLIIVVLCLSFIQKPISGLSVVPGGDRLVLMDLLIPVLFLTGVSAVIRGVLVANAVSKLVYLGILLIAYLFLSAFVSLVPSNTILESTILAYMFVFCLLLVGSFTAKDFHFLIGSISFALILALIVGLYDYLGGGLGLPRIFNTRASGEVVSGFRNAGQAGNYAFTMLAIVVPFKLAGLARSHSRKFKITVDLGVVCGILLLLLSGKIAAYVGAAVSFLVLCLVLRKFKYFFIASLSCLLVIISYNNLDIISPELKERIETKITTRVIDRYTGNYDSDGFLENNWASGIEAFYDSPLLGTGLGAFYGTYSDHEVHSTYVKILGETGLLGVTAYTLFMWSWLMVFSKRLTGNNKSRNQYLLMINYAAPFVLGLLVTWSYTYHLRKREFWIFLAVMIVCSKLADFSRRDYSSTARKQLLHAAPKKGL